MKRIMLCCCAGMSTSLLVTRTLEAAKKQGIEIECWACSESVFAAEWEKKPADCVLVGPQIRYKIKEIAKVCAPVPAEVIDMRTYGLFDGAKILELGLKVIDGAK